MTCGKAMAALAAFVDAIEATGGVVRQSDGLYAPTADEDWIDLGEAYLRACEALGTEPVVSDTSGPEVGWCEEHEKEHFLRPDGSCYESSLPDEEEA